MRDEVLCGMRCCASLMAVTADTTELRTLRVVGSDAGSGIAVNLTLHRSMPPMLQAQPIGPPTQLPPSPCKICPGAVQDLPRCRAGSAPVPCRICTRLGGRSIRSLCGRVVRLVRMVAWWVVTC